MSSDSLHTTMLKDWLRRMKDGDDAAREELFQSICGKLESLARRMLKKYPNVKRWEETGDVQQNATLRLMRALERVDPHSIRHFYALAAMTIRRELIDLARHYGGAEGIGANVKSAPKNDDSTPSAEPADTERESVDNLQRWSDFHEAVENLPAEEREVVSLIFYHGWTQAEVAELLQLGVRTVRRTWQRARLRLVERLGDRLPK